MILILPMQILSYKTEGKMKITIMEKQNAYRLF